MEDQHSETDPAGQGEFEDDELTPTPLDHPLFLPVLFIGLSAWFGYDAYFTDDPDMLEHLDFNRYGLRVLLYLGALYTYWGICEMRAIPSHAMAAPALLLLSTVWLAHDAWLSSDAHNLSRASVNGAIVPWLLAITAWNGFTGWMQMKGKREPAFILPLLILACAAWFGYSGFVDVADADTTEIALNRWASGAILAGFFVSVYYALTRPRNAPHEPKEGSDGAGP